jgi:3-phosphoshikimate 1-carboxyvinyltransferase
MVSLTSHPASPLKGDIRVPGDKSTSHRALMIAASAVGTSEIRGLLEGEDVLATANALRALGIDIAREGAGEAAIWRVAGTGVGGLFEPAQVLDLGNAGTGVRLLMGLLATHPFTSFLTGDASLVARPMERVMGPLRRIGASFQSRSQGRLPIAVTGTTAPVPIREELAVASAQVKSAILLAALNAPGETTVIEPLPTRDHTETMLRHFGADVAVERLSNGAVAVTLTGEPELTAKNVTVPGDFSSAAFPLIAALISPGSEVTVRGVGVNPLRTGALATLRDMGADLELTNETAEGGEPMADIRARAGALKGVAVPPERVPAMIDEFPVLAAAAAVAEGTSRFAGVGELRVKESDRLAAIATGLAACGVDVEESEDSLTIHGAGGPPPGGKVSGGATVAAHMDHRIAMAFLVLGAAAKAPIAVDDGSFIDTSFPGFGSLMNGLGACIQQTVEAP